MSQPPPPTGAPQDPWTSPAGPYRPPAQHVPWPDPYAPAPSPYASAPGTPAGPTGSPLDAYAYQLPPPRRRPGLVVAIVVGAVVVLAALAFVVLALVGLVGGRSYGDDPHLDRLWDSCADGGAQACDDLYLESPVGSEYEEFGDTCGNRYPSGQRLWCVGRM